MKIETLILSISKGYETSWKNYHKERSVTSILSAFCSLKSVLNVGFSLFLS
jgi:hypothetical protein